MSRAERQALFSRCFVRIRDAERATGWFYLSPPSSIRRDNVVEWLLWALFSSSRDASLGEWEEELEGYIKSIERLMGRKLENGGNERVKCMKVTMDPVVSLHRPLLWYIVSIFLVPSSHDTSLMYEQIVAIVDAYTFIYLQTHGFRHHSISNWYSYFPPRLVSPLCLPSAYPQISYWYRPHRSATKHPILFLHGIGVSLLSRTSHVPYVTCLLTSIGL